MGGDSLAYSNGGLFSIIAVKVLIPPKWNEKASIPPKGNVKVLIPPEWIERASIPPKGNVTYHSFTYRNKISTSKLDLNLIIHIYLPIFKWLHLNISSTDFNFTYPQLIMFLFVP